MIAEYSLIKRPNRLKNTGKIVLIGALLFGGLGGCQTTPVTNRKQLMLVPDRVLTEESVSVFKEMRQKLPVVKDPEVRKKVLEIGQAVIKATGSDLDWEIEVFDSPEVNAFCLPGGKIGVFSGILPVAKTNGGLAAIIGHEVAHALAHHSAERASQALVVQQIVGVVDAQMSDNKGKGLILGALSLGSQLGLLLPFNRHQETEADAIGLDYMARAGFDPQEAVGLWQRMDKLEKSRPPEWLSTHPESSRRIRDLERLLAKARPIYQASQMQKSTIQIF